MNFSSKLGTSELAQRIIGKIASVEPCADPTLGDCWVISGYRLKRGGHVRLKFHGKDYLAHRVAYECVHGAAPPILDHQCNRPSCVNPDHLKPSTHQDNVLRGIGPTADNSRKTHCPRGHKFGPNDWRTYYGTKQRRCRICYKAQQKAWKEKKALFGAQEFKK